MTAHATSLVILSDADLGEATRKAARNPNNQQSEHSKASRYEAEAMPILERHGYHHEPAHHKAEVMVQNSLSQ